MSNRQKHSKQHKSTIECALNETCARPNCTFNHSETRNLRANIIKIQQKKRENVIRLETKQMEMIMRDCWNEDTCARLDCPYRHPPHWDPVKNQRLLEMKRLEKEKKRKRQQQHALNVCDQQDESLCVSKSTDLLNGQYEYDEQYFDIQEKVWQKQNECKIDKW
ncbi:unnamed protein product [Adineta ricciae]|uniref:Uncharacterized protein n=1 Tax=Adineta ricciae TaxID=249248 RepID=A0A816FBS9_ADIRI|nr:unnamed protein product [Adineta ricciae]CAF1658373.1 unnamed protein product [Adineta ricciae]